MTKIEQLKADIASIEESVNGEMSKEALYDSLIVAYMHQKDIIVLQQDLVPVKEDLVSKAAQNEAEDTIKILQEENTALKEQLQKLQHWQDGANLEGDRLKSRITKFEEYIDNMKEQRETDALAFDAKITKYQKEIDQYVSTLGEIYQLIPSNAK